MSSTKSKSRQSFVDSVEKLGRESVHTVKQGTVKEAQESAKTFLSQLLGIDFDSQPSAKAAPVEAKHQEPIRTNGGEIFNFAKHQPQSEQNKHHTEKAQKPHIEAALDYHGEFQNKIIKSREHASATEKQEMKRSIEQIKVELARLVESSHILKMEFGGITVEQTEASVSHYHLNFLEWMLTVIRSARQKVEDSQSWMGAIKGKGDKKSYWGMFKKHGTTFGLSGERSVATQVG
jgi:hypothetical protein